MTRAIMIKDKIKKIIVAKKYGFNPKIVNLSSALYVSVNDLIFEGYAHFEGGRILGAGSLLVGDNVIAGPGLQILTEVHDYESEMLPYDGNHNTVKDVVIHKNVWIGADVTIMPGVSIGEGAVIGTKSFINKDVPPLAVVAGTPAKVIKFRDNAKYAKLVSEGKLYLHEKY